MGAVTPAATILYDTVRWEEKALAEAAKRAGAEIQVLDCRKIALQTDGEAVGYGTILQRCVSYYRNVHSTAALEGMGARVINCLQTGILAGNKLYTHMLLKKSGVRTPRAAVSFSREAALEAADSIGYPCVIKPTVGSWGRMVSRLSDADAAEGILEMREAMHPLYHIHYVEEFVKRPPRDIRAIVVGDAVVAAIYRSSSDWKTNMALGGHAEECKVTGEMEEICIKARDAVHGEIVGVDIMEDDERGLLVHEINNTTEFKNTVRVCGVDIPALIIAHVLEASRE